MDGADGLLSDTTVSGLRSSPGRVPAAAEVGPAGSRTAGSWRARPSSRAAERLPRASRIDVFLAANALLFLLMCVFAYWERWSAYMGSGRAAEFVLFALAVVAAIVATRAALPRPRVPGRLLALIEVGILAHFAGGLVHWDGARLYDHVFLGLRYDKYVHAGNAFIGGLALMQLCHLWSVPTGGFVRFLAFLAVLGLGAVVECAEFAVTRMLPNHGIGGYADTIGDLLANVCGGVLFLAIGGAVERLTGLARPTQTEPAP